MRRTISLFVLALAVPLLVSCEEARLKESIYRLRQTCGEVDPDCRKGESTRDTLEDASKLLARIRTLCDHLDTGSAICMLKLEDLTGVMGQVATLAGAWESVSNYGYKAKTVDKVQVGTAGTNYWIGAKDNKGGVYISQNNRNLVCGSTDLVPAGVNIQDFLESAEGTPGETKEDLLCEKLYPNAPLCLGTYLSMCVSSGWYENDRWMMNTDADEACIRAFKWRARSEESRQLFRKQLRCYIMGLAVELDTCSLRPSPKHKSRMLLQCGSKTVVFSDELRRM